MIASAVPAVTVDAAELVGPARPRGRDGDEEIEEGGIVLRHARQRLLPHTIEIDASHAVTVSHPSEVADLIRAAAAG